MGEIAEYLQKCATLGSLTPAQLTALASRCRQRRIRRGTSIFRAGDKLRHVYLLVEGRVRISHLSESGKQSILKLIEPGRLFGELAICHSGPCEELSESTEDSTLVTIPVGDLRQLIRENSDLSFDMITLFGSRRRQIERRLKYLLFQSTRERLICLLHELAEDYGRANGEGVRISIALSHQELGGLIGATRETVTIALGQLRNEGLLRIESREILIPQLELLR